MEKISVCISGDEVYFHVLGDNFRYMDMDLLAHRHPELSDELRSRRLDLNREMFVMKERYGVA